MCGFFQTQEAAGNRVSLILAFVVTERSHDNDEIIKMIKDRQNQLQIIFDSFSTSHSHVAMWNRTNNHRLIFRLVAISISDEFGGGDDSEKS